MNVNLVVGSAIKRIRMMKSISQEDLCKDLNVSRVTISKIERGLQNISVERLYEFAGYFNVSAKAFLPDIENEPIASDVNSSDIIMEKDKDLILNILDLDEGE